jgi:hypothetical protein
MGARRASLRVVCSSPKTPDRRSYVFYTAPVVASDVLTFTAAAYNTPGLRPLSRPLIRSSRGRSGALVGWDGCEVRLCVRVPVCVPAPPGVFLQDLT